MKLRTACLAALAVLPLADLLTLGCASVHNSQCGPLLTLPAYFLLLPAAYVINLLSLPATNDLVFWLVYAVATWAWLTVLLFVGSAIIPKRRNPRPKTSSKQRSS